MWIIWIITALIAAWFVIEIVRSERERPVLTTLPRLEPEAALSQNWWVTDQWWDSKLAEIDASWCPVMVLPAFRAA
jgi:hypothetical protein